MALTSVAAASGNRHSEYAKRGKAKALVTAVKELQGLKVKTLSGAAAVTNIAVSGIATADVLVAVLQFDVSGGNVVNVIDRLSEASVTSAGNIQLATTDTTGDKLVLIYFDVA